MEFLLLFCIIRGNCSRFSGKNYFTRLFCVILFIYGKIMTYLDLFDAKTYWQLHTKTCIATRNQLENLLITILAMCNFIFHSKRHFTMLQLILEILTNEYSFSLTFLVNCFGLNNPYLHLAPCHQIGNIFSQSRPFSFVRACSLIDIGIH